MESKWFRSYRLDSIVLYIMCVLLSKYIFHFISFQFTSVNGFDSEYRDIKYGVPQGSVIDPLIFLIYINKLHNAIKFANYINLLISNESIKTVQTQINLDLKYLVKWLNANKISLNASKTKVLISDIK